MFYNEQFAKEIVQKYLDERKMIGIKDIPNQNHVFLNYANFLVPTGQEYFLTLYEGKAFLFEWDTYFGKLNLVTDYADYFKNRVELKFHVFRDRESKKSLSDQYKDRFTIVEFVAKTFRFGNNYNEFDNQTLFVKDIIDYGSNPHVFLSYERFIDPQEDKYQIVNSSDGSYNDLLRNVMAHVKGGSSMSVLTCMKSLDGKYASAQWEIYHPWYLSLRIFENLAIKKFPVCKRFHDMYFNGINEFFFVDYTDILHYSNNSDLGFFMSHMQHLAQYANRIYTMGYFHEFTEKMYMNVVRVWNTIFDLMYYENHKPEEDYIQNPMIKPLYSKMNIFERNLFTKYMKDKLVERAATFIYLKEMENHSISLLG